MIIAIPVDDNKLDVCVSLGRTPYFLFHDTETSITTFEVNPGADASGGAGLASAQFLVDHRVDILITVRCGQNAADVLQETNMKIYKSMEGSASDNIAAFSADSLLILDHFHGGFHGIGGN